MLIIRENWLAYKTKTWDIDFQKSTLIVREAARKIFFEITFEPPSQVTINRARLLCNGVELLVRKKHVFVVNTDSLFARNTSINCTIGVQIGRNQRGFSSAFSMPPEIVKRNYMTSEDVDRRERKALRKHEINNGKN